MPEQKRAVVFGGINTDIGGKPEGELWLRESNIGRIGVGCGGVGRNIAADLVQLGVQTELCAAIGSGMFGEMQREDCRQQGVGLRFAPQVELPANLYLYIDDEDGDLYTAINDMRAAESLTPALIPDAAFEAADVMILDANLPEETLAYIAHKAREKGVPLFADPVSAAKAPRLKPLLPLLHTLKPNILEAEALTGEKEPDAALFALRELGVGRAFLTMGADGVCFIWEGGSGSVHVDAGARVIDATGAGDSVTAALAAAYLHNFTAEDSAMFAMRVAQMTIGVRGAVSPALSKQALFSKR